MADSLLLHFNDLLHEKFPHPNTRKAWLVENAHPVFHEIDNTSNENISLIPEKALTLGYNFTEISLAIIGLQEKLRSDGWSPLGAV